MVIVFAWFYSEKKQVDQDHSNCLTDTINIKQILCKTPTGTPQHLEDEYKLSVIDNGNFLKRDPYLLDLICNKLEMAVLNDSLWKATKHTSKSYSVAKEGKGMFYFMDFYLDTPDLLNKKSGVSHRVRYRWHSSKSLWRYIYGSRQSKDFPYRCEFQTKIYQINNKDKKIFQAQETRFEFRNQSIPFKNDLSAPKPPWAFEKFIPYAIRGHYKNYTLSTAYAYSKFINTRFPDIKSLVLQPSLVIITARRRLHLNLSSKYGLISSQLGMGAIQNSNQAILLTLDTSTVYSASLLDTYLFANSAQKKKSLSKRLIKRLKNSTKPLGNFSEFECEFERNVSSSLYREIEESSNAAKSTSLESIKASFLSDVKTTSDIVVDLLKDKGMTIRSSRTPKYIKAVNILMSSELKL